MKELKYTELSKRYNRKQRKIIKHATATGAISTWIKHPETGKSIRVHPELVKRLQNGERIAINLIEELEKTLITH